MAKKRNKFYEDSAVTELKSSEPTIEWTRYEHCRNFLLGINAYDNLDKAHKFYEGDQWEGEPPNKGTPRPVINVIKPIVQYKLSHIAQHNFQLNFSYNMRKMDAWDELSNDICSKIGGKITDCWENNNMDSKMWEFINENELGGGVACYSYYDSEKQDVAVEVKDNTEIQFGDEQQEDIQKQPYIILPYRDTVFNLRKIAKENGLNEEEVSKIVSDDELSEQPGAASKTEVENDDEFAKALALLYLTRKDDGYIYMTRSTRTVRFVPETNTKLKNYPIAFMVWNKIKGCVRGKGEVLPLINNQIEINQGMARRQTAVKIFAFPKAAYLTEYIQNPQEIMNVGTAIGINGGNLNGQGITSAAKVNDIISYLKPAQMSSDAKELIAELVTMTKELAGASDAALGNVNPEQSSGKAILAVLDAAATPLNVQISRTKQFVEDIGRCWWDILAANQGSEILFNEKEMTVTESNQKLDEKQRQALADAITNVISNSVKMRVRVDATPTNPYSRYAEVASLESYMMNDKITFEEFIEVLPDNSIIPKDKFKQIMGIRQQIQQLQQKVIGMEMQRQNAINRGMQEMQRATNVINELRGQGNQSKPMQPSVAGNTIASAR